VRAGRPAIGVVIVVLAELVGGSPGAAQQAAFPQGDAFTRPREAFTPGDQRRFDRGSGIFQQAWVVAPSIDHREFEGLGPLFNSRSCGACHVKNGRGKTPGEGEPLRTMVVRLSVARASSPAGIEPHPVYGGQLNPEGVSGAPGEGVASFSFETQVVTLGDGERVELRKPKVEFRHLAYGPIGDETGLSVRNAPPVFGLGLLEDVPEDALREIARQNGGRVNEVWNVQLGRKSAGRFGLKANQPSIVQQNANAFVEDLGITSSLFPRETCTAAQEACSDRLRVPRPPELSDARLDAVTFYVAQLAPPSRRDLLSPDVALGESVFRDIGCGSCHREALPIRQGGDIHPYTDLLLHDLGEGLADSRTDYEAGPRDWRTPPLWGVGLAGGLGEAPNYLHDGRARNLTEAIVWHGGEAEAAATAFKSLSRGKRDQLLRFLNSL
jgi:CxxC motif-containing protein (DUF1111 family)